MDDRPQQRAETHLDTARVTVLMPTYRQADYLPRALESLLAQSLTKWKLLVLCDGSDDKVLEIVGSMQDSRMHVETWVDNKGLGAALNYLEAQVTTEYLAYLPSDDVFGRDHLKTLVNVLDHAKHVHLAYGGMQLGLNKSNSAGLEFHRGATLLGAAPVGDEHSYLFSTEDRAVWGDIDRTGNLFALVQVMRRRLDGFWPAWVERTEHVSDRLLAEHWRKLASAGARFRYSGQVSTQWTQHPFQMSKIISGRSRSLALAAGGESMYRSWYGVPSRQHLDWRSSQSHRAVSVPITPVAPSMAHPDVERKRILLVGDLGFNPERLLVLESRGIQLAGLWLTRPESWMSTGPFGWGAIQNILAVDGWESEVERFAPDIVHFGLNWPSLPLATQFLDARLGYPLITQFKEGPGYAMERGLWPDAIRVMREASARIYFCDFAAEWWRAALPKTAKSLPELVMDGDLPPASWFAGDTFSKLSAEDSEPHTVCAGRWMAGDLLADVLAAGIHVHLCGAANQAKQVKMLERLRGSRFLHLHPDVSADRWTSEFSKYDAGWLHVTRSQNYGDLHMADWDDLNIPGRLPIYAAAGLPVIHLDNAADGHRTSVEDLTRNLGIGMPFSSVAELSLKLDVELSDRLGAANMQAVRRQFTFDDHVDKYLGLVDDAIARYRSAR